MSGQKLRLAIRKIIRENMDNLPDRKKWWTYDPEDIMKFEYWKQGLMPPSDPVEWEKNWNNIKSQLQKKFPPPSDPGIKLKEKPAKDGLKWVKEENTGGYYAKGFGPAFSLANVKPAQESTEINKMWELKIKKDGRTYKKSNFTDLDEVNKVFKVITGQDIKFEEEQPMACCPDADINIDPLLKQKGLIQKEGYAEFVETAEDLAQPVEPGLKIDLDQYVQKKISEVVFNNSDDIDLTKVDGKINAPFVKSQIMTLGGPGRESLAIRISLDKKEDWQNGIFQNSRYMLFMISNDDDSIKMISGARFPIKFRAARVKSLQDVVDRINKYITLVSGDTQNAIHEEFDIWTCMECHYQSGKRFNKCPKCGSGEVENLG